MTWVGRIVRRGITELARLARRRPKAAEADPLDQWDYERSGKARYGDDTTYREGIAFLDGHGTIEDWGCGPGYARRFVRESGYVGVDGSPSSAADKVVDLRAYTSRTECIFMRHVLEHNHEWRRILANAVASFTRRMVLVIFTPFAETTRVVAVSPHGKLVKAAVPDISFRKADLTAFFSDCRYAEESVTTGTQYGREHIFYIEKRV